MTTVVNSPAAGDSSGTSAGMLIGIVLVILLLLFLFGWGLPAMRGGGTSGGTGTNNAAPNVNIPDKGTLDVNINKGQ
jgi:hypothetical protein